MMVLVMNMECLFCNIAKKEAPSYTLYEDDFCVAILDAFPNVDGHTLVIPKKHYTDFTELDEEILLHIYSVAKRLSKSLMEKLNAASISFVVNYGDSQKVKHFHLHLLPNFGQKKKVKMTPEEMYKLLTTAKDA